MLGRFPRLVKRQQDGQFVNGRWVPGAPVELIIEMSAQPVSGVELEFLPEARRTKQTLKFYSAKELIPQNQNGTGDVIVMAYGEFEVVSCEPYQSGLINHYKSLGQKL